MRRHSWSEQAAMSRCFKDGGVPANRYAPKSTLSQTLDASRREMALALKPASMA
jgi:hypothetical protein